MSITARIRTDSLRKLLEDNTEVWLELESMACEKIAEEITRKALKMSIDANAVTESAKKAAGEVARTTLRDHRNWPPDANAEIKKIVMGHLKDQRVAMIDEFRDALITVEADRVKAWDDALKTAVTKHYDGIKGELNALKAEIKAEARKAFFEVLQEARSA